MLRGPCPLADLGGAAYCCAEYDWDATEGCDCEDEGRFMYAYGYGELPGVCSGEDAEDGAMVRLVGVNGLSASTGVIGPEKLLVAE